MRDINLGAARRAARMRSSETLFILPGFVTRTLGEHKLLLFPGGEKLIFKITHNLKTEKSADFFRILQGSGADIQVFAGNLV